MSDGVLKHLSRRTASDKESRGKSFNVAKNPRYDLYQCGLALVLYFFFFFFLIKNLLVLQLTQEQEVILKSQKSIIRKTKKPEVYSSLRATFGLQI